MLNDPTTDVVDDKVFVLCLSVPVADYCASYVVTKSACLVHWGLGNTCNFRV